jgi:hypothetical protein
MFQSQATHLAGKTILFPVINGRSKKETGGNKDRKGIF